MNDQIEKLTKAKKRVEILLYEFRVKYKNEIEQNWLEKKIEKHLTNSFKSIMKKIEKEEVYIKYIETKTKQHGKDI